MPSTRRLTQEIANAEVVLANTNRKLTQVVASAEVASDSTSRRLTQEIASAEVQMASQSRRLSQIVASAETVIARRDNADTLANAFDPANKTNYATGTFNTGSGTFLTCAVANSKGSTPDIPSMIGLGLTWTQIETYLCDTSGQQFRITLFGAISYDPLTNEAAAALFGVNTQTGCCIIVDEHTNIDISLGVANAIVQVKTGSVNTSGTSETIDLDPMSNFFNASCGVFLYQAFEGTGVPGPGHKKLGGGGHTGEAATMLTQYGYIGQSVVSASWTTSALKGGIAFELRTKIGNLDPSPEDTQSSTTIDTVTVTKRIVLAPADMLSSTTMDAVTTTGVFRFTPADMSLAVGAEDVPFLDDQPARPNDASVSISMDAVSVERSSSGSGSGSPAIGELAIGEDSDTTLDVITVNPAEMNLAVAMDAVTINLPRSVVDPEDAAVSISMDQVDVTKHVAIAPEDLDVSISMEETTIIRIVQATPQDMVSAIVIDSVTLTGLVTVMVENMTTNVYVDEPTIVKYTTVIPAEMASTTTMDEVGLALLSRVAPDNMGVGIALDEVVISNRLAIFPDDMFVGTGIKYRVILKKAFTNVETRTPSTVILMEAPGIKIETNNPGATIKES